MVIQQYRYGGLLGCVVTRKSRLTGTHVSIYNCEQAMIDGGVDEPETYNEDGTIATPAKPYLWACVCEDHGTITGVSTLGRAYAHLPVADWCEQCMENLEQVADGKD